MRGKTYKVQDAQSSCNWYGPRRMRSFRWVRSVSLSAALASFVLLAVAAPGGADPGSVSDLRQQNASLAADSESALVELYALESRLRAQVDAVSAERASVRGRLRLVRRAVAISQRDLGRRLVRIYEDGQPDTLAIFLGAESLSDALTDLDHLHSLAAQDKHMLLEARRARASLLRLTRSLAAREERLAGLEQEASTAAADLYPFWFPSSAKDPLPPLERSGVAAGE